MKCVHIYSRKRKFSLIKQQTLSHYVGKQLDKQATHTWKRFIEQRDAFALLYAKFGKYNDDGRYFYVFINESSWKAQLAEN